MRHGTRFWALLMLLALLPSAYVAWRGPDLPELGLLYDDGVYWATAKSIAEGSGYRLLHAPGAPHQTLYPPLYPSLLSIAWRIRPHFPDNAPVALWSSWLMLPLLLIMADRLAVSMRAPPAARMALPVWLALNPIVIFYSVNLISELMFTCLLTGCVWLTVRSLPPSATAPTALLAGLAGGLAYLTRTAGIVLLPAVIVCFLGARSYRKAALFLGGMLPAVAAWQGWTVMHADELGSYDYRTYVSHFYELSWLQFLATARANLNAIFLRLPAQLMWSLDPWPFVEYAVGACLIAMIVYRLCSPRRAQHPAAVVAAFYLGMLVVWPDITNAKLLLPIMPLLLAILATVKRASWTRNPFVIATLGVVALSNIVVTYAAAFQVVPSNLARYREFGQENKPVYEWLRMNSGSASIATDNDALVYLHTGHPALRPRILVADWYGPQSELNLHFHMRIADIARSKGGFLVVHCGRWEGAAGPPLCSTPEQFHDLRPIARTKDVRLFQVDAVSQ